MIGLFIPIHEVIGDPYKRLKWARRVLQKAARQQASEIQSWDVWQWTRRKYRIRAMILLMINAILFAGLGCFTFWLRTGELTPLASQHYRQIWWAAFDPTSEQQITLVDFLVYPIPVDQVPLMVVIVGLVLASLTAIPILVSMLYGFRFSLIFICIIGILAVLPWMAFTVTICCYMVRMKRFQFSFRYATALISLLPLVIYYTLSTRNASVTAHLPPVELAKLYLPCVLALIAACVLIAIVMTIAKLSNYRPGAIAPLMAAMFAIPVVLFEAKVGRDELYYRLIETRYGTGSKTYFVDHIDADQIIREIAIEHYEQNKNPRVTLNGIMEQIRVGLQLQLASGKSVREEITSRIHGDFATQRHMAIQECNDFRTDYPESRYIPNVLYLTGRAIDMRVDDELFFIQNQLVLRHYEDFPRTASKPVWEELYTRFPDNPSAGIAAYRLSLLEAREGRIDRAIELLNELIQRFGTDDKKNTGGENINGWAAFLAKRRASGKLNVDPSAVVHDGRKLRNLLINNRDPQYEDWPLRRLLSFDPRHSDFRRNLNNLLNKLYTHYRLSPLIDNIELLIITTEPSRSRKIEHLKNYVEKYAQDAKNDALAQARFDLAVTYQTDNRLEEAKAMYEEVIRFHQESPWEKEANRRLEEMRMTAWSK